MAASLILKMLEKNYAVIGLNVKDTYRKTDLLLKLYRKASWGMCEKFDDLNEITYEKSLGGEDMLNYLLNFAPDRELEVFRTRAETAIQTRALIDLIDKSAVKMKEYPDSGAMYYSIIDLKYLNYFKYSEEDILEELDLERSTYYRKKKEAITLLGYILFGISMPDHISSQKVANF